MSTLKRHTAAGKALGYFFQIERALSWIAISPAGSVIGIETEDDVVVELANGEKILEQDKSSITSHPFSPSKPDLWKTLLIWLEALDNNEIDIDRTTLYLVTNKSSVTSIAETIGSAKSDKEITDCLKILREKAAAVSGDVRTYVDKVMAFSDQMLSKIIRKIEYKSGNGLVGDELRKQLASDLQLDMNDSDQYQSIIKELLGWLFFQTTDAWRQKQPAFIDRDSFMREKITIITNSRQKILDEYVVGFGMIPEHEERQHWENKYVKQLKLIGYDGDKIIGAIHDYINAVAKKTNMAVAGYLTYEQLDEFDKSLERRWDKIFERIPLQYKEHSPEEKGKLVYLETMECDTSIGEYQLRNHFITSGTYHALADGLKVGWHKDFKSAFAKPPFTDIKKPSRKSKKDA